MITLHKLSAGCLGIGYLKGGGTLAAMAVCAGWYLLQPDEKFNSWMILVTICMGVLGTWSAGAVEKDWGKDSSRIVIDEAAGMCISLLFIPVTIPYLITGLILFRFFDILKPLYIRKTESLPGGWGVMTDDVLAGIYANLLLQVSVYFSII